EDVKIIDNDKPMIADVAAYPIHQTLGEYVNITCTVTDNIAVDTVNVSISGPPGFSSFNTSMNRGNGESYYYNQSHYTQVGMYEFYILATDISGNSNVTPVYFFEITGPPPEISNVTFITSDPPDTDIGWENFSCTVTDNTAVDEVKLVLTGDTQVEYPMSKDGDDYYCNMTLSTADEYTYHIWANDTNRNYNTSAYQPFNLSMNEDVNEDGKVHFMDLVRISLEYNDELDPPIDGWLREDVNNDGKVHFMDL
ncbi:unnamed protein product, partial [marine sediment metagenome]